MATKKTKTARKKAHAKKKATKKKAPAKKKAAKKKKRVVSNGLWVDLNFPDGSIVTGSTSSLVSSQSEVEAYYTLELQTICQTLLLDYSIYKFTWSELTGIPKITKLEIYVTPKPVRMTRPGGGYSSIRPPAPPPPPPPYLS